jgi:hypothetical protein
VDIFGSYYSVGLLALALVSAFLFAIGGRDRPVLDGLGMIALLGTVIWAFVQIGLLAAIGLLIGVMIAMLVLRLVLRPAWKR